MFVMRKPESYFIRKWIYKSLSDNKNRIILLKGIWYNADATSIYDKLPAKVHINWSFPPLKLATCRPRLVCLTSLTPPFLSSTVDNPSKNMVGHWPVSLACCWIKEHQRSMMTWCLLSALPREWEDFLDKQPSNLKDNHNREDGKCVI